MTTQSFNQLTHMYSKSHTPNFRQPLGIATLASVWLSSLFTAGGATTLTGNHSIVASTSPTEAGNLTIEGHFGAAKGLDVGITTIGATNYAAINLEWLNTGPDSKTASFDIADADASYQWRDNLVASATARNKMKLNSSNTLSLFKSEGTTAGIILDPNMGSVTLGGLNSGIYNSSSLSPLISFGTGTITFPIRPLFSDGIDFGSGKLLNSNNVSYMRDLMTNFGYRENPVVATPVEKFAFTNATITSAVTIGSRTSGNGRFYVVGNFVGGTSIGGITVASSGSQDAFVAKLFASGSPEWVRVIGGASSDSATSVSVDNSGNVYVGGNFEVATTSLGAANLTSAGSSDGYVAKFNSNGTLEWAKPIGGISLDSVASVAVDASGNLIAVGSFSGATTNMGGSNVTSAGGDDGYVAKFHTGGNIQWAKPIGGASVDRAASVAVDINGNAVVAGTFAGSMLNLGSSNISTAGGDDGYLAKFDSSGVVQWAKPIGGLSSDSINSVIADSGGNLFVAGNINGNTTNLGINNISWLGSIDGYVAKLDTTGTIQWAKLVGGTSYDVAERVCLDSSGNIYVAGTFQGNFTTLGAANLVNYGLNDGYVVRLNSAGGFIDSAAVGGLGVDSVKGILAWESQVYVWGATGALVGTLASSFDFGNTRISRGGFMVGWPALTVVTPSVIPNARLSWGGTAATGAGSTALGGNSFAQGVNSVALGNGISIGASSLSSGNAVASGSSSTALGSGTALGTNSVVLGAGIASGSWSVASGPASRASGQASLAGGGNQTGSPVEVSGVSSIAWGQKLSVSGTYAQAFGYGNMAYGNCSTAFGCTTTAKAAGSFALGCYNVSQGNPTNWVATDDLFVAGNGDSVTDPSNAITTLKNGQTTLTNKAWSKRNPSTISAMEDPSSEPTDSGGNALVVDGHTVLNGKVVISVAQGDINMGIYGE